MVAQFPKGQAMQADVIAIHEHMANAIALDPGGKGGRKGLRRTAVGQTLLAAEAEFMQRQAELVNGHPLGFKVPAEAGEKEP